jgi:hypothetical protein
MAYTAQMRREIRAIPVPHDFVMDIVEYDFYPPYIALRFYESHWRHLSEKQRIKCALYMDKVKKIIEAYGVSVTLDPVYDVPGGQQLL